MWGLFLAQEHSIFGVKHIIILCICAALVVLGFIFSKKLSLSQVIKVALSIGLVSEVVKVLYFTIANQTEAYAYLPKTDLPFHLCSIQILFLVFLRYSKNENLKKIVLSFMVPSCLFGGIAALMLPTHSSRNGSYIITCQYFLYHIAIILFAMYVLRSKEVVFELKDYFNCLKFLAVIGFFAIYLNGILNDGSGKINFMYVVKPPEDNLPFLTIKYGWGVYMVHYAFTAVFFITLTYIKVIIKSFKKNKVKA